MDQMQKIFSVVIAHSGGCRFFADMMLWIRCSRFFHLSWQTQAAVDFFQLLLHVQMLLCSLLSRSPRQVVNQMQ